MQNGPLKLLHLTDTHLLGNPEGTFRGVAPLATLQAVQKHAAARFPNPDGILLTGDLVQDDPSGYGQIKNCFTDTNIPVYCIPGNHDVPEAMRATLQEKPFVLHDHVLLDPWLIVLLDSWQAGRVDGALGTEQLQKLDALLNRYHELHALVCLHHHPVRMGSRWLDQIGLQDAETFRHCIGRHESVRGVLWGHVHQELDMDIDGVQYMATPATCRQFLPGSDGFAVDMRPPGYRTLQLQADGTIRTQVVWL